MGGSLEPPVILYVSLKIKKGFYSRFFVKALPEGLFKYASNSRDFWRSVKAMAVLTRQGLYFDVWGFFPWLWDFKRDSRSFVKPV